MGIGGILNAVSGLASAGGTIANIFNKPKKPKGPEGQSNDRMREIVRTPSYIVEGAKRAGIHPLVAFGSSFTSSIGQPVYDSFSGSDIGSALGGLSNAAGAAGDYYQDREDRARAEQRSDERDMLSALADEKQQAFTSKQIELIDAQIQESRSRSMLDAARAGAIGGVGGSGKTLVGPGGITFRPEPGRTSASEAEQEYGEAGDIIFGAGGLLDDVVNNRIDSARIKNPFGAEKPWFDVPAWWRRNFGG